MGLIDHMHNLDDHKKITVSRAYVSLAAGEVRLTSDIEIVGRLAKKLPFALLPTQTAAWEYQVKHLRVLANDLPEAHFFLEFLIPRMGRRADLIVLYRGIVFVVEYKIGARQFDQSSLDQVYGYGLDLKHFHENSHNRPVVPILVATAAGTANLQAVKWDADKLSRPLRAAPASLSSIIVTISEKTNYQTIDPHSWALGGYRPTPTIVEAAQALYRGHNVEEISRSEAGAENLTVTANYVAEAIEIAKREHQKLICFITGVPGSGKTLAGLNLATARQRAHRDEHAVFLSGNGPLVEVLREALALDGVERAKSSGQTTSRVSEERRAAAFIQNIHHFRDAALASKAAPTEKVAVFDEAQRAWDTEQTSKFMQRKRGQIGFSMSEPEFLLSVMDRHKDWCAIICLIGNGQEINTGEAGINEWLNALNRSFPHWRTHLAPSLAELSTNKNKISAPALHLATSIRSFRAERLSDFIGYVIAGQTEAAKGVSELLPRYPLYLTRDLEAARLWLRSKRRGQERMGLLASSNAARLKPHGVFVKAKIEPAKWFLAPSQDVRSSDALEDAATEFDVQGLELDWGCLCWDINYRRTREAWKGFQFKGTKWEEVNNEARKSYIANSYRVLLTRARQGLVVFVPEGSSEDHTRPPDQYDAVFRYLLACGFHHLTSTHN